jgi:hypothetical protein
MRNKWYVIGFAVGAALCLWLAASWAMGDGGMMAAVPASLAVALIVVAVRIARADSFAPSRAGRWDQRSTPGVSSWMQRREEGPRKPPPAAPH